MWIKSFVLELLADPRPQDRNLLPDAPNNTNGPLHPANTASSTSSSSSSSSANIPTAPLEAMNLPLVPRPTRKAQVTAVNHHLKCLSLTDGTHAIYAFLTPQCLQDYPTDKELKELKYSAIRLDQYHLSTYKVASANRADNAVQVYRQAPLLLQVSKITVMGGHDVEQIQSSQDINQDPEVKRLYMQYHSFHLATRLGLKQFNKTSHKVLPDSEGQVFNLPYFDETRPLQESDCLVPADQAQIIAQITSFERSAILHRRELLLKQCEEEKVRQITGEEASSSPSILVMQDLLQNTLTETLQEEDEEFFPKGFHPSLSFSIIDGELAYTQVDETQIEEQDPTGGYRIEFLTQQSPGRAPAATAAAAIALATQTQTETQIPSQTQVESTSVSVGTALAMEPTAAANAAAAANAKVVPAAHVVPAVAVPTNPAQLAAPEGAPAVTDVASQPATNPVSAPARVAAALATMFIPRPANGILVDPAAQQASSSSSSSSSNANNPRQTPTRQASKAPTALLKLQPPASVVLESTQVPTPEDKVKQQTQDEIAPSFAAAKKPISAASMPSATADKPVMRTQGRATRSSVAGQDGQDDKAKKSTKSGYESESSVGSRRVTRSQQATNNNTATNASVHAHNTAPAVVAEQEGRKVTSAVFHITNTSSELSSGVRTRRQKAKDVQPSPDQDNRREALIGRRVVKNFPNVGLVRGAVVAYSNNAYTVLYEDGYFEDLLFYQLTKLLDPQDDGYINLPAWKVFQQWFEQKFAHLGLMVSNEPASSFVPVSVESIAQRRSARKKHLEEHSADTDKELNQVKAIHQELNKLLAPTPRPEEDVEMTQPQFGYQEEDEEAEEKTVKGNQKKQLSPLLEGDAEDEVTPAVSRNNKRKLSSRLEEQVDPSKGASSSSSSSANVLNVQAKLLQKMQSLQRRLSDPTKLVTAQRKQSPAALLPSPTERALPTTHSAAKQPLDVAIESKHIVSKLLTILQKKRKFSSDSQDAKPPSGTSSRMSLPSAHFKHDDDEEEEGQVRKKSKATPSINKATPLPPQTALRTPAIPSQPPKPPTKPNHHHHHTATSSTISSSSSTATVKQSVATASGSTMTDQDILNKTLRFLKKKAKLV